MCYLIGKAIQSALTRRNILGGGMALGALLCTPIQAAADIQRKQCPQHYRRHWRARLVHNLTDR